MLREFRRRDRTPVTAVRLDLDTDGFSYRKWGSTQHCKRGDWVVNNRGDIYTVDAESFARTYRLRDDGRYDKLSHVWAEVASQSGTIRTKEGSTAYDAGDYLVFNEPHGRDGYAMKAETFGELYEPCEPIASTP